MADQPLIFQFDMPEQPNDDDQQNCLTQRAEVLKDYREVHVDDQYHHRADWLMVDPLVTR